MQSLGRQTTAFNATRCKVVDGGHVLHTLHLFVQLDGMAAADKLAWLVTALFLCWDICTVDACAWAYTLVWLRRRLWQVSSARLPSQLCTQLADSQASCRHVPVQGG